MGIKITMRKTRFKFINNLIQKIANINLIITDVMIIGKTDSVAIDINNEESKNVLLEFPAIINHEITYNHFINHTCIKNKHVFRWIKKIIGEK